MPNRGYVVITRDEETNARWQGQLERSGFDVYSLPCIHTAPLEPPLSCTTLLQQLNTFDWIIFTSASAVRYFTTLMRNHSATTPQSVSAHIAVVGEDSAQTAKEAGWQVTFKPTAADSETLAREIPINSSSKLLWPRSARAPRDLAEILEQRGAEVVDVPIYTTEPVSNPDSKFDEMLKTEKVSAIIFASPSAIEGFRHRVGEKVWQAALDIPVIATGERTATAARDFGFRQITTAGQPTIEDVVVSLRNLI